MHSTSVFIFIFLLTVQSFSQRANIKIDSTMFRHEYDFPHNIPHGTWDFDEWPGVDHPVIYKSDFSYNDNPTDKFKIDYFKTSFDHDDHEGYLKKPEELLAHGFQDIREILQLNSSNKKIVGIFTHPDDELLLAGGLLYAAKQLGWEVSVYLASNGADGSEGASVLPSKELHGYNAIGIQSNSKIKIGTDKRGEDNLRAIEKYSKILGVNIQIMQFDFKIDSMRVVQLGENPGSNLKLTFEPNSPFRAELAKKINAILSDEKPSIVLTHGSDGEYGNYYHRTVHDLVINILTENILFQKTILFTCFPEYNYHDHITHFLDLYEDERKALSKKWNALRTLKYLYKPEADFDKPWEPSIQKSNRVFVKDYGYTPIDGEPPRYEFFSRVNFSKSDR